MNRQELAEAFREIGIAPGMALEVHSSLRSLGHVEGGAEAVIGALMDCVGTEGSIFMPALSLSTELPLTDDDRRMGVTSKIRILPPDAPRTAMGLVADTFRLRKDVVMGEGVIRTAGWGKHADEAARGGLDYVIHHGGRALLLGVDIYRLTAMHYMEDVLPEEISAIFAPTPQILAQYPPEEWMVEAGTPPVKAWYTIQAQAMQQGLIRTGHIGPCPYMFFTVSDVTGLYRRALEEDPFGLYGLK